jgi:pyruvate, water dikinase
MKDFIKPFQQLSMTDVAKVGGKNASLGEMISALSGLGVSVPDGFAITVDAYSEFLALNSLQRPLEAILNTLDRKSLSNLATVGTQCRELMLKANLPERVEKAIRHAYEILMQRGLVHSKNIYRTAEEIVEIFKADNPLENVHLKALKNLWDLQTLTIQ